MKKILWAIVAVLALGMACFFVGCGPQEPSESEIYAAVAGEYSNATNNTVTDDQNQQTDVWDNVLTLKEDKTYSYHMTVTNTIYGSLVYGKLDVTVGGTYTATEKSEGVYTIVLSEATSLDGKGQLVIDPVTNRELQDCTFDLDTAKTLAIGEGADAVDCKMTFLYSTRTFDLDTTVEADSYESFEDPLLDDQTLMMYIEGLRQKEGLGISY